jgi:hypothetical protein
MLEPQDSTSGSHQKVDWICDCGKTTNLSVCTVVRGNTSSCRKCNQLSAEELRTRKFGKLRIKTPVDLLPGSRTKVIWLCDCGNETQCQPLSVTTGHTTSCGKCFQKSSRHIKKIRTKSNIQHLSDKIPSASVSIVEFIRSLGLEVVQEYLVNGLEYDMFVPSHNLLIGYNGLKWHNFPGSRQRDFIKYKAAIAAGCSHISIFEDEWLRNRSKIENLFRNRLIISKPRNLRPSQCTIRPIPKIECDGFYNAHHYIGTCTAKVHYGVFFENQLMACASFSIPTRQSKHPWELLRMVSHPDYRVHGIWSKLIQKFIADFQPSSIVSFSDNRLFSGAVYEKIGFKFDGDVAPDYFWVKDNRRFHKSGLRKRGIERLSEFTETELRTAQGYHKIWDLGKKRWVIVLSK